MTLDPAGLLRRYHAALQPYAADEVAGMFAEEAVYVSPGVNGRLEGRAAIMRAFDAYFAEHPDQQSVDEKVEVLGERSARARWRLTATSATTGQAVERRGVETVRFDEAGLILKVEVEDR
jgi:uncharacterized protein (TIGR02246 family)